MKKTYIIVIAIILMTGFLAAKEKCMQECSDGKQREHDRIEENHPEGMMFLEMAEELELTEIQIERLHQMKMDHKKYMIQIQSEIKILQVDKQAAMKAKDFSKAKEITEQIFEKKQLIAQKRIDLKKEHWNLLSAEQRLKAEEMKHNKKHSPHKMSEKVEGKHKK